MTHKEFFVTPRERNESTSTTEQDHSTLKTERHLVSQAQPQRAGITHSPCPQCRSASCSAHQQSLLQSRWFLNVWALAMVWFGQQRAPAGTGWKESVSHCETWAEPLHGLRGPCRARARRGSASGACCAPAAAILISAGTVPGENVSSLLQLNTATERPDTKGQAAFHLKCAGLFSRSENNGSVIHVYI